VRLTGKQLAAEREKNLAELERREWEHDVTCTIVVSLFLGVPSWLFYDEHRKTMTADADRASRPPPPPRPQPPPRWERDPNWKCKKRRR
jgi:hypothetical protein